MKQVVPEKFSTHGHEKGIEYIEAWFVVDGNLDTVKTSTNLDRLSVLPDRVRRLPQGNVRQCLRPRRW
jgi:hypothetical protein